MLGPVDALTVLAEPTRRRIVEALRRRESSVSDLVAVLDMSQPAISKHLKVLERAGLISADVDGQRRPRRLEGDAMLVPIEWLERYRAAWEANYQRLDTLLAELQAKPVRRKRKKK